MFLTANELEKLTGRKRKSAQCRVLFLRGIPYTMDADDRPVVLQSRVEAINAPKKEGSAPPPLRILEARGLLAGKERKVDKARG